MVGEAERLRNELDSTAQRAALVEEFLGSYQLSSAEVATLQRDGEDAVDEDFFQALSRVQTIHQNCR